MAEIATIARPYAEALFKSGQPAQAKALADEVQALADVAANEQLRRYADDPGVSRTAVVDFITAVVSERSLLSVPAHNLLRAVVDNGRLAALPEIASQFHALLDAQSGIAMATIHSAFPIDESQLSTLVETLEKRFGRRLQASVVLEPELIGGVRAVVGDEVLDMSVKARLEQMKAALASA